jgi:hypothetical protein
VVSFTARPLYIQRENPPVPVVPRAGLDYVEKRKFLTLPGLEEPG